MTRRKRSPSPSLPRKRVAFEIPNSLQQLSALSRTLAQQADTLAGVDQDDQNARIIAQAQAMKERPYQVLAVEHKPEMALPGFQKFRPQRKAFPEAQTWVKQQPRPLPESKQPDTHFFNAQTSVQQPQALVYTKKPSTPESISQTPAAQIFVTKANDEPPAKKGEPLCLATQPQQIAALIAKKREENELNRRREKWAREQFAHRLSQAPDDQLLSELHDELSQQAAAPWPADRPRLPKCEKILGQVATESGRVESDKVLDYTNSGRQSRLDGSGAEVLPVPARRNQDSTPQFSSTITSPASATVDKTERQTFPSSNVYPAHGHNHLQQNSFAEQLLSATSSMAPRAPPKAAPQSQSQHHKPTQHPPKSSYIRQPAQQRQQHPHQQRSQPPQQYHSPAQMNLAANGPGYYRIDPRFWNEASTSEVLSPYVSSPSQSQSSFQSMAISSSNGYNSMPNLGEGFHNLTQNRFGQYGVNGEFIEGPQAGQLSDIRTRTNAAAAKGAGAGKEGIGL